jgi:hypothetical protein
MSETTLRGWIRDDGVDRHYDCFLITSEFSSIEIQSHKFNTECAEITRALDSTKICVYVHAWPTYSTKYSSPLCRGV